MFVEKNGIVYELNIKTKKGSVKYSDCMLQEAKILDKVNGCVIDTIESKAFYHCEKLKKIMLPNTITKIKNEVFCGCYKLEKINNDNNLYIENIGFYAFKDCHSLISIKFKNLITLGKGTFENCYNLKFVYLPKSSLSILEENVFCNCVSLQELVLTKGISKVKNNFKGCDSLKKIIFENGELKPDEFIMNINKDVILYGEDGWKIQEMALYGYKFILNKYKNMYH